MALTSSQMAMWKTVVALIHADEKVHPDESKFLMDYLEKLPVTPEQKQELLRHAETPGNPRELFTDISEPRDRSHLIYFARLLFFSDGDFSEQEKRIFDLLHSDTMDKVEISEAMLVANRVVSDFKKKEQENKDSQPLHRKVINALTFWVDLDSLE